MSANAYMETVTGFSASLLQSLDGDTAKAAEYADMAVRDMSDNANKMGTDISMIQNAYQGFAKQNYTMLDNLKLGYGGTQAEMQRLIAHAAELDSSIDANSMSFDNIVLAINAVQKEMGIYGSTEAEAIETVSGSINSMMAAWENLAVGFADENADIEQLLNNFLASVATVADNILPIVERVLSNIFQTIADNAPQMIASGAALLGKLAAGILQAIPQIIQSIPMIIEALVEGFKESGPDILQIGVDIVKGIWEGIKSLAGWFGDQVRNFFGGIVNDVKDALGIHSPSRVFAGIGENMALGLGEGWDSEYNSVKRGITNGLDFGSASVDFASSGLGVSSAGIINSIGGASSANGVVNLQMNLVTAEGEILSRWLLNDLINVAKANGTPILNPS